jgi:hypothetical protein
VIRAFGQRNLDRYLARTERLLDENPPAAWTATLDILFDEYVAMRRSVPGFAVVDFDLVGAGDASQHVAEFVATFGSRNAQVTATPELMRALRVAVEVADSLVRLAFRTDPAGDEMILAEAKQMIGGYLAPHLA